jgi:zinc protease
MKLRIHGLALATLLLCGMGSARAQQQPSASGPAPTRTPPAAVKADAAKTDAGLPSAEEVLASYTKALGGAAALARHKSRVAKGTIELAPMSARGTLITSQKAPNKLLVVMNLTGLGEFRQGYDGQLGWANDPFQGLRELKGSELAATRRGAVFNPAERNALYKKMAVTGRSKVGDREVYVIEATPAEGEPDKMYFDTKTGLMLRMDTVTDGPQGRVIAESYMEDYREVGGILAPHTVRQVVGPIIIIQRLESVEHDAPLDDAIFRKPSV